MTPMSLLPIVMRLHEACLLPATHATDTNLSASCRSSGLRLQGITLQQRSICSHLCWNPWSVDHVRWTKKFCQCHRVGYHRTGCATKNLLQGRPASEGRMIENTPAACGGCWRGLQIPCHPLLALPASSSSAVRQAAQNLSNSSYLHWASC